MTVVEKDLRKALDPAAFARSELSELLPELDPWQEDLLRCRSKRVIVNASRQSGKSTIAAIRALHRSVYRPGSLVLCLSPSLRQSSELFAKCLEFYRFLGKPIPADSETRLSLALENGSRVVSLPGSSDATIRGFSGVDLLLVDEAAYVTDELFYAARPMLATSGGTLMMLSTPYRRTGVFFDVWHDKQDLGRWARFEVPADKVPRITEAFLKEERALLPEPIVRREYFCSFEDLGESLFDREQVAVSVTAAIPAIFGKRREA